MDCGCTTQTEDEGGRLVSHSQHLKNDETGSDSCQDHDDSDNDNDDDDDRYNTNEDCEEGFEVASGMTTTNTTSALPVFEHRGRSMYEV